MRRTQALLAALAVLPLDRPAVPWPAAGEEPVAHILVDTEHRVSTYVNARAFGGQLRVPAPTPELRMAVTVATPTVIEVHGTPDAVFIESAPDRPLRVRVVSGSRSGNPRAYHGWKFHLERRGDRYVPVAYGLRAPPR